MERETFSGTSYPRFIMLVGYIRDDHDRKMLYIRNSEGDYDRLRESMAKEVLKWLEGKGYYVFREDEWVEFKTNP